MGSDREYQGISCKFFAVGPYQSLIRLDIGLVSLVEEGIL